MYQAPSLFKFQYDNTLRQISDIFSRMASYLNSNMIIL